MMSSRTVLKKAEVVLFSTILVIFLNTTGVKGCVHHVNKTEGFLSSPNFPNPYPPSQNCIWKFMVNPGETIKLVFHFIELERNLKCEFDYVALYDGDTVNDPFLGKFCNSRVTSPITSTGHKMILLFHSDSGTQYRGFKVEYMRVNEVRSVNGTVNVERNLTAFYLRTRRQETRSINKWGTSLTKTAVALFLNDQRFFAPGNTTGEEMTYELSLQLLSKLALQKRISTKELAQYINALIVACVDPKDFFGINLVDDLRNRIRNSNNINPFYILTLCNAKDTMTMDDTLKLQQQFKAHFRPVWTDTQAMVVMALSCIHSRSDLNLDKRALDEMVHELKRKQHRNGTIDNLKTAALVVQALFYAGRYRADFDLTAAIKFIVHEIRKTFPNPQDIYYVLPVFNMMSLANISSDHCQIPVKTDLQVTIDPLEQPDERIIVQISVIVGDNMDFSRTWKVKVPSNYSFYEVLENIGTVEPAYKVQYSVSDGKPYVRGLTNFQDDAEDGLYWFIYTKPLSSTGTSRLIEESPVDIQVNETEEMILWYRSGFWTNTQNDSSN